MHLRHDPENPTSLSSDTVNVVFEDAAGMLWVGTAAGFDGFDRKAPRPLNATLMTRVIQLR